MTDMPRIALNSDTPRPSGLSVLQPLFLKEAKAVTQKLNPS